MDEAILPIVGPGNEAKALLVVEPLDGSLHSHVAALPRVTVLSADPRTGHANLVEWLGGILRKVMDGRPIFDIGARRGCGLESDRADMLLIGKGESWQQMLPGSTGTDAKVGVGRIRAGAPMVETAAVFPGT